MTTQDILDKCRKLSRLAASPVNSNEAGLAAARLAEIMVKYQISEIDLESSETSDSRVNSHLFLDSSRKSHWKMSICSGCARLFNCIAYWHGSDIHLIGRESDVILCRYLFYSIVSQIESLCDSEWNRYYLESVLGVLEDDDSIEDEDDNKNILWDSLGDRDRSAPLESRKSWSASFLLACSSVVKSRLLDKHRCSIMSSLNSESHALTVFNNRYRESLQYAKSMSWSKSTINSPSSSSVSGYTQGAKSGHQVRIDKLTHNLPLLKGPNNDSV
jgi:Protein of unknown function (DUF2786)